MRRHCHMPRYESITLSGSDYNGLMDEIHEKERVAKEAVDYLALLGGEPAKWARDQRRRHAWLRDEG